MATANAAFARADVNNDQQLDLNEFRDFANGSGASYGSSSYGAATDLGGLGATSGASYYESSSYNSSGSNVGGDAAFGSTVGMASNDLSTTSYSSLSQTNTAQQYATDAQGLFIDNNPQIVRRPAAGGVQTYTQNIRVRFLQPPPVPPPGPLIIKEVRPPQPAPPPPLRIRQQAPPLPQPPPLILRERPPVPPATVASQTVIRRLSAIPVPPRSVIIERIPAAPPRPRDIIIERWIPYGAQAKRQTIVQRAAAAQQYSVPRNIIIQYETPQVRVIRQFQRLGVTQENPAAYFQRYGATLLDSQTLVQQARAIGVVEDISPPRVATSFTAGSSQFASSSTGSAGFVGSSSYESSPSSYSNTGDLAAVGAGYGGTGFGGISSYESSSYGSSTGTTFGGSSADAAFAAVDVNRDRVLSQGEFPGAGY